MQAEYERRQQAEESLVQAEDHIRINENRLPTSSSTAPPKRELALQIDSDDETNSMINAYQAGHELSKLIKQLIPY